MPGELRAMHDCGGVRSRISDTIYCDSYPIQPKTAETISNAQHAVSSVAFRKNCREGYPLSKVKARRSNETVRSFYADGSLKIEAVALCRVLTTQLDTSQCFLVHADPTSSP